VPGRALAVGAHPDDVEFGAGATLARWAAAGCTVTLAVVTDGAKGSWDPGQDPAELAARRAAEQAAAAETLGVAEVVRLEYPDGELEPSLELRAAVCRLVRRHRPDVLLSHDPWERYQLHPDHRATGFAAVDGVVAARDPLFFPEQELPAHRPAAILLWSADEPDHAEPASAAFLERKVAALLCHTSQGTTTMGGAERDEAAATTFRRRVREWARACGERLGTGPAEVFKRLTP